MGVALPNLRTSIGTHGVGISLPMIPLWVPEEARRQLTGLVLASMRLALQDAAGYISDEAPVSEGMLAQSFGTDPASTTGGIELFGSDTSAELAGRTFSSLPYAIVMDQGRRKGAPISMAGIDAIGLWAQRKLGLNASEANHAKWAIANSIVAKGIAPTYFFSKGVKRAEPRIQQVFAILGNQIAVALTREGKG